MYIFKYFIFNYTFIVNNFIFIVSCFISVIRTIHSINFSKGAKVLFFEEPSCSNKSYIIEPIVNGEVIRTYVNKDYMFKEKL